MARKSSGLQLLQDAGDLRGLPDEINANGQRFVTTPFESIGIVL